MTVSWRTSVPTSYRAEIQWFLEGEPVGPATVVDGSMLATEHRFSVDAPDPEAEGSCFIGPVGETAWFEPVSCVFPPYGWRDAVEVSEPWEASAEHPATDGAEMGATTMGDSEVEPNDSPEDATPIAPGLCHASHDYVRDPDWFVFDAFARKVVRIAVDRPFSPKPDEESYLVIEVFKPGDDSSELVRVEWRAFVGMGDGWMDFSLYEDVRLFLRIQEQTPYYVGPYTLSLTFLDNLDMQEPDSLEAPRLLEPGAPPVPWYQQDYFDLDYFAVSVPPGPADQIVELEFSTSPGGICLAMFYPEDAYPPYGIRLVGSEFSAGFKAPVSGLYRFEVRGDRCPQSPYYVSAFVLPNPDTYEPNDVLSSAASWPAADALQAYFQWVKDRDWYSFRLVKDQTVTINVTPKFPFFGYVSVHYRLGSSWRFARWRAASLPAKFKAPADGEYYLLINQRKRYYHDYFGSSAREPYTLELAGLGALAPTLATPADGALVSPLDVVVTWTFDPGDGVLQQAYQVQIARDPAFDEIVYDSQAATSADMRCAVGRLEVGDYYVRVRVQTSSGTWSGWSRAHAFRAGLVRIVQGPQFYYATDLGPDSVATFLCELATDCVLGLSVLDGERRTVWHSPGESLGPGLHEVVWPGAIVSSPSYPLPFAVMLAPRGNYFLRVAAQALAEPSLTDSSEYAFLVAW
ncbi:MAG TPA: hypothetical protein DHW14_07960 [Clostridiales bacterium]|nr:hypothetical protein [Clostridiales bacterium]